MLKEIAPGKLIKIYVYLFSDFVNSQEPDQGQPCLHKKFRLSFKQAAKTLSELPTINEAVLMHYHDLCFERKLEQKCQKFSTEICRFYSFKNHCLLHSMFAYVDKIIGNKSHMMP